jgi:hypothetical protein
VRFRLLRMARSWSPSLKSRPACSYSGCSTMSPVSARRLAWRVFHRLCQAGFGVAYVTQYGVQARVGLTGTAVLPLERAVPVWRLVSYEGQRHFPGSWWSATDGRHVGYESWLERDHLAAFDFDPAVTGIALLPA